MSDSIEQRWVEAECARQRHPLHYMTVITGTSWVWRRCVCSDEWTDDGPWGWPYE